MGVGVRAGIALAYSGNDQHGFHVLGKKHSSLFIV